MGVVGIGAKSDLKHVGIAVAVTVVVGAGAAMRPEAYQGSRIIKQVCYRQVRGRRIVGSAGQGKDVIPRVPAEPVIEIRGIRVDDDAVIFSTAAIAASLVRSSGTMR